jgi:Ca2+-binding RTX toxin-like protein
MGQYFWNTYNGLGNKEDAPIQNPVITPKGNRTLFEQLLLDESVIKDELAEKVLRGEENEIIELLEELKATAAGLQQFQSGLDEFYQVKLNNTESNITEFDFQTHAHNTQSDYQLPNTWQFELPVQTQQVDVVSPALPTPIPQPTLSAFANINGTQVLFENKTARDLTETIQYDVGGKTIDYEVTGNKVSFTTPNAWGDIKGLVFTGDAYDLQNKTLSIAKFKDVEISMFDSPSLVGLENLPLTAIVEGAKNTDISATNQADTITINHSANLDGNNGLIKVDTYAGDDIVVIQPSKITYRVNGIKNDKTGKTIDTEINTGHGNDSVDASKSQSTDVMYLGSGDDTAKGGGSDDRLFGQAGSDILDGGDGNDTLSGGQDDDILKGGRGNDTFLVEENGGYDNYNGGKGYDAIVSNGQGVTIGLSQTFNKTNRIESIEGDSGTNTIVGTSVNNSWDFRFTNLNSIEAIKSFDGNDTVRGSTSGDIIYGGNGNDLLYGYHGGDTLMGEAGADRLYGENGQDILIGGQGNDRMWGGNDDDTFIVDNNSGFDDFYGGSGSDTILSTSIDSNIQLKTRFGNSNSIEVIDGQTGTNFIVGNSAKDSWDFRNTSLDNIDGIKTFGGNDTVRGSQDSDSIYGGDGKDKLFGYDGADTLLGELGNDKLYGLNGDDRLEGGQGNDFVDGGSDTDTAVFSQAFSDYTFTFKGTIPTGTLRSFNGVDGNDTYKKVEYFEFSDGTKSLQEIIDSISVPPIVLDLDGDGLEYSSDMILFDVDNDGQMESMYWVGEDDGILTYDKDNSGGITDKSEISFVEYSDDANTDLEGLRAFDTNFDNIFDAQDNKWSSFGITQNNQFKSMDEMGIKALYLESDNNIQMPQEGVVEYGQGSYLKEDGQEGVFSDVAFLFEENANSLEEILNSTENNSQVEATSQSANQIIETPVIPIILEQVPIEQATSIVE